IRRSIASIVRPPNSWPPRFCANECWKMGKSLASCTLGVVEEGLTIGHEELQVADLGMIERRKVDLADNAVRNREPYPLAVEYAVSIRSFALCGRSARKRRRALPPAQFEAEQQTCAGSRAMGSSRRRSLS